VIIQWDFLFFAKLAKFFTAQAVICPLFLTSPYHLFSPSLIQDITLRSNSVPVGIQGGCLSVGG
jgi:hypothetical protein